ncbi:MAG TPA: DUF1634 domain-containing protein [Bryobacteraceae bacterium]|jgi:uncharacterized membrane protein|nr:DUF1634 domain-containing protein [Bryobacteraceae bacterium]
MYTDEELDRQMGLLLRVCVIVSCAVILAGGVLYLIRHGRESEQFGMFHGVPGYLETVPGVFREARADGARAIIQLGVLFLIATPVLRVVFAVWGFARQRRRLYVGISLTVLALLAWGIFGQR